ncbi:hypothetical protein FRC03_006159 [Tulasnella sp. 419]|nr:hypothetical protein FRC02_009381 [Tulasnella sp. 418]KAG8960765.1 hypothetical protein FRC03_006159 [Tulasnella sp. 419]
MAAPTARTTIPSIRIIHSEQQQTSLQSQRMTCASELSARIDEFFGVTQPLRAVVLERSVIEDNGPGRISMASTLPPPYDTPDAPAPAYDDIQEPATLSRCFFYYGFVFPLFWILGALILFITLRPTPESECGKTAEQQAEELAIIRRTEIRWSQKCVLAIFILIIAITITVVTLSLCRT